MNPSQKKFRFAWVLENSHGNTHHEDGSDQGETKTGINALDYRPAPRRDDKALLAIQSFFLHQYIRSHFTSLSQSSPSAPFSIISFSRAWRAALWLEPISPFTKGAHATRSGWLMTTTGCGHDL